MPDPYDYTSAFANLPNPEESFLSGIKNGVALNQLQAQQEQQRAALAQQQQQAQVISQLMANPSAGADEYSKAMLAVPGMSEQLKQAWATKSAAQQRQQLSDLSQWGAALQNNQPQLVVDGMNARADAIENTVGAPTPDSQALRAQAQAIKAHPEYGKFIINAMLVAHPDGGKVVDAIATLGKESRAAAQAPADLASANAKAASDQADAYLKNRGIVAQTAGALAKPGVKPTQVEAMFRSLASKKLIPEDELQGYLDGIPSDSKDIPAYLKQVQASGMTSKEQMTYTTPTADAKLQSDTTRRDQDIRHAQWKQEQEDANQPAKPNETLAKQIAFYRAPPLGQFNMNKPWGQATMDMVMQLNPNYDAAQYAPRAAALRSFAAGGKDGAAIESANTAMNHLATLKELALAQKNGDTRLFNKIANRISEATGSAPPSNLKVAVQMVAPEVVKAVSGVGGTGEDRAHTAAALAGDGTYSADQVLGAVGTAQELFGGRLKEKKRSYERSTGLKDFEDAFLSPAARSLLTGKGGGDGKGASTKPAKSASGHPADIDYLINKYGNQ
jgi:hypothetical protein